MCAAILDAVRRKALASRRGGCAPARSRGRAVCSSGRSCGPGRTVYPPPLWVNDVREGGRMRMGLVNALTGEVALGEPVRRQRGR